MRFTKLIALSVLLIMSSTALAEEKSDEKTDEKIEQTSIDVSPAEQEIIDRFLNSDKKIQEDAKIRDNEAEKAIINRFMKKVEKKHVRKIGWVSANFTLDRINRNNDYNTFATYETRNFNNGTVEWLRQGGSFGLEAGLVLRTKFAISAGFEYWMKLGQTESGNYSYTPLGASLATSVSDLNSEISVWGVTTSFNYYLSGHPTTELSSHQLGLRVGSSIGYYQASWDLWEGFNNYNITTSTTDASSNTFSGSGPGFSLNAGLDYPLKFYGLVAGFDASYLYLNLKNVAWYNDIDQEIVATYNGTEETRVDLDLSGFRGKIEVKKFYSW